MNFRNDIQCNVCGNSFVVKVQGGFVENSKVRIACPKCQSLIKGNIFQKGSRFNITFENAQRIDRIEDGKFALISISTELPIVKNIYVENPIGYSLSPYMALFPYIKPEKQGVFRDRFLDFNSFRNKNIAKLELLIELFHNKRWDYFIKESKYFALNISETSIESFSYCSNIMSEIISQFILKLIPVNYEQSYAIRLLHKNTLTKVQMNKMALIDIASKMSKYINMEAEFNGAIDILFSFIKNAENYLPVIALSYGFGVDKEVPEDFYIVTTSFDEIKDRYKDSFELLSRTSLIYLGFRNYVKNGDIDNCIGLTACTSLADYYGKNNGLKKAVLDQVPDFVKYYRFLLNNQIRNAIGHYNTEYSLQTQLIKYYPYTDITKKDKSKEISLTSFTFHLYLLHLLFFDLVRFLGKWNYRLQ